MNPADFDQIVSNYKHLTPNAARLQGIENHVWRAINSQRYDQPRNRLEAFLMQIFTPSHQWTAMAAALVVGLFTAYVSAPALPPPTAQALRLDVFEANYAAPLNVLMKQKGNS